MTDTVPLPSAWTHRTLSTTFTSSATPSGNAPSVYMSSGDRFTTCARTNASLCTLYMTSSPFRRSTLAKNTRW